MEQARVDNQTRLRPYVVKREYVLYGKDKSKTKSEVTAEVTFSPPKSKNYIIRESSGSNLGERIVRRMLDGETQIVKDYGATDISPANYDFRLVGEEDVAGQRCFVLELLPKRNDKTLLRGNMWVDAVTYLLRRMEAEPAKGPSWWLRDVRLAFVYGDVDGMWLQTSSEFTTNVRIFGRHTMTSRDVSYEGAENASVETLEPSTARQASDHPEQGCSSPCVSSSSKGIRAEQVEYSSKPR
jgi:hypothetical protein